MRRFVRELRRREIFRTLGLYVGLCWILIEAASILLPAFEGPQWALRVLIIVAIVRVPVVGGLAWIYDVTDRRITRDAGRSNTVVPAFGGRRMDFVVIGGVWHWWLPCAAISLRSRRGWVPPVGLNPAALASRWMLSSTTEPRGAAG